VVEETEDSSYYPRPLSSISINTDEYFGIRKIRFETKREVTYMNIGKTPATIIKVVHSSMHQKEWESIYHKDPRLLMDSLVNTGVISILKTDVVVLPDSSQKSKGPLGTDRFMDKVDFERYRDSLGQTVLYPYTLAVYEDPYGYRYNVLYMEHIILPIETDENGFVKVSAKAKKTALEKYRWDL